MILRSDRVSGEELRWFDQFKPFAWICYYRSAEIRRWEINSIEDARRLLIRKEHHHLIKLQKEPFCYILKTKDDWISYGLQSVYFLVSDVYSRNRWYQPIRHAGIENQHNPFWITEDIEVGIEYSKQIADCPNCCQDRQPWPEAAIAVPIAEIARYFSEIGWDKRIVDEIILHKDVDWAIQESFLSD